VRIPTLLVIVAYWVIGIPIGYVFAFVFNMGAPGIWLGLITGLTLASIFLVIRFLKMTKR